MKAGSLPASPDAYVDSLNGWQGACVEKLRAAVGKAGAGEIVKWGPPRLRRERPGLHGPRRNASLALNQKVGDPTKLCCSEQESVARLAVAIRRW